MIDGRTPTFPPRALLAALLAALAAAGAPAQEAAGVEAHLVEHYTTDGTEIVGHDVGRYNNRPLYANQTSAVVLAGDRPLLRCGAGSVLEGTLMIAVARGGKAKWLHEWASTTSRYRADHMAWDLADPAFAGLTATLEAVPPAEGSGMAVRLRLAGAAPGDELIWACGGAVALKQSVLNTWDVTTHGREPLLRIGFVPDDCLDDRIAVDGARCTIQVVAGKPSAGLAGLEVACSAPGALSVGDAGQWADPLALAASAAGERPLACGRVRADAPGDVYWALAGRGRPAGAAAAPAAWFAAGLQRTEEIGNRVTAHTPDARLDAMVTAASAVMDGVFRDGIFTHSGMRWGVPLLGWRTLFGGTAYGWHERVLQQARICLARQVTATTKDHPVASAPHGLTCQALDSRLFGRGRVDAYQTWHYDMQSQFFDQLIHAWRWTGDPELERLLRPALELHLEYIRACFDPDDDGLYESYANTWPTDDQWYDGGGTAEETAYAYQGHRAARELAARAGDQAAVQRHDARLAKIKQAFLAKLWAPGAEHVGAWVEQGGHARLHEDCWLYAIFCPIDAGLLDQHQAAQSLSYTEWGLERERMPYGGERCWTSNWVPSLWSLREMWPGDNYHLALAYYQAGLGDEAWNLLRGTFPRMAFYGPVPGDLGHPNGATDFNDSAGMFCRAVVEGLFGYRPDYTTGTVTIAPQLPSAWDRASITTPDVAISIAPGTCTVTLAKPAALDLRLPVRARRLTAVRVNGQPAQAELLPGVGCSIARIIVPRGSVARVELDCADPLPQYAPLAVDAVRGEARALEVEGPATVVTPAVLPTTAGHHLAEALVMVGDAPQRRFFKVTVRDPAAEAEAAAHELAAIPAGARWDCLDLRASLNADVRTIFQQQYLSPRPDTCSLRLGVDGCSTWQQMLDPKHHAPLIDLEGVPALRAGADGRVRGPLGVPFAWPGAERNIAFTSMWDNWPRQVTVPVGRRGEAVSLLLCGFTNPMQGRIANAELRLHYGDGSSETVELVPPVNFWSMCPFGTADYDYQRDGFCLPAAPPLTIQLGGNCRAVVINRRLAAGKTLASITLETLSQEVIIGLMGVSVMNPVGP